MTRIAGLLGPEGPIARAMGQGYEPRREQVAMASAVADAMEQRSSLLVEAGTGVGKSFAYLVPAVDRILNRGETVVVATNTIALQEQLVRKDVPLLAASVGRTEGWVGELRPVLVKGRSNYLSIRRLELAAERAETVLRDVESRIALKQVIEWAGETLDGTLSTLPQLERQEVWDQVRSDSDNCMGRACPNYQSCFYQNARREAERGNLLICNHALFFSDLALRSAGAAILPRYDHVILDEAHGLEDAASEHFGLSLPEGRVNHLLRTLYEPRRRKGYLAHMMHAPLSGDPDVVSAAIEATLSARSAAKRFFDSCAEVHRKVGGARLREPGLIEDTLSRPLADLALRLRHLREAVKSDQDRFELQSYARRATELAETTELLVEQRQEGAVYWIESTATSRGERVGLACAPIKVAEILREHLFGQDFSVTLTSATLSTRTASPDEATEHAETAFAHVMARLGCEGAATLQLGSPFDHAAQVELYVDRSMVPPTGMNAARYAEDLVPRIMDHVIATDGGAFVLCTSFAMVNELADRLGPALASLDMPLLVHGREHSRTALLEIFGRNPRSVLLGADSFWQGVDLRGDALRNVIITRLPFEPPDRPLAQARHEQIEREGGQPFRDDSLPRAIIRFKQGFGRLIRSGSDRGRVVVLDPRLVTARYGRLFLAALPEGIEPRILGLPSDDRN